MANGYYCSQTGGLIPPWLPCVSKTVTVLLNFSDFCYPNYSDSNCCRLANALSRRLLFNTHSHPLLGHVNPHFRGKETESQRPRRQFLSAEPSPQPAPMGPYPVHDDIACLPEEACSRLPVVFVFVSMWAEISSRRPSGPVTPTGGASPLSTITTCSQAASW